MAARKSIVIVSAAPSNAITNIAQELANRGHFTIFASGEPGKHARSFKGASNLQCIQVDTHSPTSLARASVIVASTLIESGFSGLDVLIHDVGVGSPLALLDITMDESPEEYETKISDALSLYLAFSGLLELSGGKTVNMSSSGAIISALGMNRVSRFSAERAVVGMSEHMRTEASASNIAIETVMLETVPSATTATPSVIFPETSKYSHAKNAFSRWTWGANARSSLEPLFDMVLEESNDRAPAWLWGSRPLGASKPGWHMMV